MKDNRGVSLVELLIAMAIAAIVSGSIAYLLNTSLRMYSRETVDITLQQELQITVNQIMDYAMESQFVSSQFNGSKKYLALGTVSGNKLNAQIFWQDGNKLYLKKESGITIDSSVEATLAGKVPSAGSSLSKNLLAQYVEDFNVSVNGLDDTSHNYENPVSLDIYLKFKESNSTVTKEVKDRAILRNRLNVTIYNDGAAYTPLMSSP